MDTFLRREGSPSLSFLARSPRSAARSLLRADWTGTVVHDVVFLCLNENIYAVDFPPNASLFSHHDQTHVPFAFRYEDTWPNRKLTARECGTSFPDTHVVLGRLRLSCSLNF